MARESQVRVEVGDRKSLTIGKFHRRNLRQKLVAKENILSKITENSAEKSTHSIIVLKWTTVADRIQSTFEREQGQGKSWLHYCET